MPEGPAGREQNGGRAGFAIANFPVPVDRPVRISAGTSWARLPLPGSLGHVNSWLLSDGPGVAIVDTGMNLPECRAVWEVLLAGDLKGRPVTRVIGTHFHPDHIGLASWLAEKFESSIWMTRGEWLTARTMAFDAARDASPELHAHWTSAGWSDDQVSRQVSRGWTPYANMIAPLPTAFVRIAEGDRLAIGDAVWRVVVGAGHSPEHACLLNERDGLLIAGDQVLPAISSNVSLGFTEPDGDPLGDWLASIERLRSLPADLLVLPSHGEPFYGLHARLDALRDEHLARLADLHRLLAEPRRSVDCFGTLFKRAIDDRVLGLATGEALAHLRRLERDGRAVRTVRNGVWWFEASAEHGERLLDRAEARVH